MAAIHCGAGWHKRKPAASGHTVAISLENIARIVDEVAIAQHAQTYIIVATIHQHGRGQGRAHGGPVE